MTTRMRLIGWNLHPVVMADDGENLTPVNVGPVMIPAGAAWEAFKGGGDDAALAEVRRQVEGLTPEAEAPHP